MPRITRNAIGARRSEQRGSMMMEVMVSVLLLSVAVLGLVRVLGTTVRDSGDIEYRSVAAAVADESLARMWIDRSNLAAHVVTNEDVTQLPTGKRTITVAGNVVNVLITWQAPGDPVRRHRVSATIAGN
jgi:type IV pilus assembly protein PilV